MPTTHRSWPLGPTDVLAHFAAKGPFSSVEEVLKTVIIEAGNGTYRIEVMKSYTYDGTFSSHHFTAHVYVLAELEMQTNDGRDVVVWTTYEDFPWVHQDTADGALGSALSFLEERVP